jgi:hypothetical protein
MFKVGICRECVELDRRQLLALEFRVAKDNLNASLARSFPAESRRFP